MERLGTMLSQVFKLMSVWLRSQSKILTRGGFDYSESDYRASIWKHGSVKPIHRIMNLSTSIRRRTCSCNQCTIYCRTVEILAPSFFWFFGNNLLPHDLNRKSGKAIERRICEAPSETCTETCGSQNNAGKCWIEYLGKEVRWVLSQPYNSVQLFQGENARENAESYCEERIRNFHSTSIHFYLVWKVDPYKSKVAVTQFLAILILVELGLLK